MKDEALFEDRVEAGRHLADRLRALKLSDPIVLALPRGGVPVAHEIARALGAELDVLFVRKIGAPGHPELALGAVMDGADPQIVVNDDVARALGGDIDVYLERQAPIVLEEIERRRLQYRGDRPPPALAGREVVIVDDGAATGATFRAALKGLRGAAAARLIGAVPVAPANVAEALGELADDFVCLHAPKAFHAVSVYYRDFTQVDDSEVARLLKQAGVEEAAPAP